MTKTTQYCDFCECEITKESGKNGFCMEVGYSRGGWGRRENFINPISVEICDKCFGHAEKEVKRFKERIRGIPKNEKEVFPKKLIEKALSKEMPTYEIGVDNCDKNNLAYCLVRKIGDSTEVILAKTMKNEDKFNHEVKKLEKYFKAVVVKPLKYKPKKTMAELYLELVNKYNQ